MQPAITTRSARQPGKSLAIFAGVHGNEKAGVIALQRAIKTLSIRRGTVHSVIANPQAVKQNQRFIEKNLNRCFVKPNRDRSVEDELARILMGLLDKCDALLDLHGYNGREDRPFLICEKPSFDLARQLDFNIVSYGWAKAQPGGTDSYMYAQNKIAICAECGSNLLPKKYSALAFETIQKFLQYFDAIDSTQGPTINRSQQFIEATKSIVKQSNSFSFDRPYVNFDHLIPGKVFATDGQRRYIAQNNECIIFPRPQAAVGSEACVIGRITG